MSVEYSDTDRDEIDLSLNHEIDETSSSSSATNGADNNNTTGSGVDANAPVAPVVEESTGQRFIGVRWSDFLTVPLQRRLQTLAVLGFVLMPFGHILSWVATYWLLLFPLTTLPMAAYLIFIFFFDKSPSNGRRSPWLRGFSCFFHFCNYFPLSIVKTAELDPNGKYLFGYHPHGIISIGALGNFAFQGTGFGDLFPGIDLRVATLPLNFKVPFMREILLGGGAVDSNFNTCCNVLNRGPGSALMLVVGGAAESLDARPGVMDLTLKRYGFVRVALQNGASLVPVLSFGENDVYTEVLDQSRGSRTRRIQETIQKWLGFATPLFHGRGILNYDFGLLPFRHPIVSVVGKPIPMPKFEGSVNSPEGLAVVQDLHQQYVTALQALWDNYKDIYYRKRRGSLNIVG
eukprot:gnl/Spiro4/2232_TR1077_c0_g1_i1.p1 gnl/Spiro4/2232_TR1077_c0_g1~~gnl/Spiro4/2232_TR1077_c0_g1_i1.p1  ORF type:complete len:434 (+),score=88.91 gnl/Spiro4/2232_TR1077_c0_g1_i1:96-1304(+)